MPRVGALFSRSRSFGPFRLPDSYLQPALGKLVRPWEHTRQGEAPAGGSGGGSSGDGGVGPHTGRQRGGRGQQSEPWTTECLGRWAVGMAEGDIYVRGSASQLTQPACPAEEM